mmetsp:Transcript_88974/g.160463  ORF Transcript_88974/g.160463 Transcript_88974/m.160463 type:complete len:235 (-) Transcript_88974:347-1051(-)
MTNCARDVALVAWQHKVVNTTGRIVEAAVLARHDHRSAGHDLLAAFQFEVHLTGIRIDITNADRRACISLGTSVLGYVHPLVADRHWICLRAAALRVGPVELPVLLDVLVGAGCRLRESDERQLAPHQALGALSHRGTFVGLIHACVLTDPVRRHAVHEGVAASENAARDAGRIDDAGLPHRTLRITRTFVALRTGPNTRGLCISCLRVDVGAADVTHRLGPTDARRVGVAFFA